MNYSFAHRNTQPTRYSSRKRIFHDNSYIQNSQPQQQEELYRLTAKIRSLDDDIASILEYNRQLESDNRSLQSMLRDLQESIKYQEQQINRLTERINREEQSADAIADYQQDLRKLAVVIEQLHNTINERTKSVEELKKRRGNAMNQQINLKQENNTLLFENNKFLQQVDQLFGGMHIQGIDLEEGTKIEMVIRHCTTLQKEIIRGKAQLQILKNNSHQQILTLKEKRIQCQYNIELLRERNRDYEQKKYHLRHACNEDHIQSVIDDMLQKEHQLRQQISLQGADNNKITVTTQEAVAACHQSIERQRGNLQSEIKMLKMDRDVAQNDKIRIMTELQKLEESLQLALQQGYTISKEYKEDFGEESARVEELQRENAALQREHDLLMEQIGLLRVDLST